MHPFAMIALHTKNLHTLQKAWTQDTKGLSRRLIFHIGKSEMNLLWKQAKELAN